ncbi:MAG: SDR family oxidoreductase [Verrucomicrobiota bacterium JB022]|nr:SDR family oxidoreductase [Verrucomicrobiota bacterium JB022]
MSQDNIQGKTVVITGASSGIGEAIARRLAKAGANVVLGARRQDRLDALVKELEAAGGKAIARATDVTKADDLEALVQAAIDTYGRIDVLVNNAGLMPLSPLEEKRLDEWNQMVDVNIKGVLYGIAAALPHMKAQQSGHIINVSSVAGHVVFPSSAVYCGTKFAVRAITEGLRQEAKPYLRTTIISPGAVESELLDGVKHGATKEALSGIAALRIPADSIARAVAYAIDEDPAVDVNEVLVRPTAQQL